MYAFSLSASKMVPPVSGIYIIFNQESCAYYIGSSLNIRERLREHLRALQRQTHRNRYLQRAYNLHGPDAFLFDILELVEDEAILIPREQHWLDTSTATYNLSPTAGSPRGVKHTEEMRRRNSERQLGQVPWNKGRPLEDEEARRKMSEAKQGKAPWNKGKKGVQAAWNKDVPMKEESKEKCREAGLKKYKSETPEQHERRKANLAKGLETIQLRKRAREQAHIARLLQPSDAPITPLDPSGYKPLTLWDTDAS